MSNIYFELEDYIEKIVSESPEEVFKDITLTKEQIKRNYHWFYDRYEKGSLLQYQLSCELPKEKYEC